MKTVHELRIDGWKVDVIHNYDKVYYSKWNNLPLTNGQTTVYITKGDQWARAQAYCSKKDIYNRKRGVRVALGRALKHLNMESK